MYCPQLNISPVGSWSRQSLLGFCKASRRQAVLAKHMILMSCVTSCALTITVENIYIYLFIYFFKTFQLDIILKIYMRMSENHRRYHFHGSSSSCYGRGLGTLRNRLTPYTGNRMIQWKATPTALHNIQCWWWWCDCNWMLSTHVSAEQNLLEQNHDSTMPKLVAIIPKSIASCNSTWETHLLSSPVPRI